MVSRSQAHTYCNHECMPTLFLHHASSHNHFTARNHHMYILEENRQIKALAFITNTVMTVITDPVYVQLFLRPVSCFNPSTSIFHVATKFGERNEPFSTSLSLMGTINRTYRAHFPPCFLQSWSG